jgi:hypothetical protein
MNSRASLLKLDAYFYSTITEILDQRLLKITRWFWALVENHKEVREDVDEHEIRMRTLEREVRGLRQWRDGLQENRKK